MRKFLYLISSLIYCLNAYAQTAVADDSVNWMQEGERKQFQDYLVNAFQQSGATRMVCVVVEKGKQPLIVEAGRSAGEPVPLGWATLPLTSLLAAQMVDDGRLQWDSNAESIYPRFRWAGADEDDITFAQLFSMTAGVPSTTDALVRSIEGSPRDAYSILGQRYPEAPVGEKFIASQTSAAAAAWLLVIADGHSDDSLEEDFQQIAQEKLLEPLGLSETNYEAKPYAAFMPTSQAVSTAGDIASWLQIELSGGKLPSGKQFASEKDVAHRFEPIMRDGTISAGLGWERHFHRKHFIYTAGGADKDTGQIAVAGLIKHFDVGYFLYLDSAKREARSAAQDMTANIFDFMLEVRQ